MTLVPTRALRTFFSLGQVIPTYRLHKSPHGGPFQPAISETISLLDTPQHNWVHIFPEGRVSLSSQLFLSVITLTNQ